MKYVHREERQSTYFTQFTTATTMDYYRCYYILLHTSHAPNTV